jgi:preprotein translocase subunit SecA
MSHEDASEYLTNLALRVYDAREATFTSPVMRELERVVLLRCVDNNWMDHIDAMHELRRGIGLSGYAQVDPRKEYKRIGADMFEQMIAEIKAETVSNCYSVTLETETERHTVVQIGGEKKDENVDQSILNAMAGGSGATEQDAQVPEREFKQETVRRDRPKVGRNDPCPCGSGKKYKNCCMQKDLARERGE